MQTKTTTLFIVGAVLLGAQNQSLQDLLKGGVRRGGSAPQQQQPQQAAPSAPGAVEPRAGSAARVHRDESGFSVNVPEGWQVRKYDRGVVTVNGPSPSEFVLLMPVLGRTTDCATSLQTNLTKGWAAYPGASDVAVEPVTRGAVARFYFQQRQSRAMILCAETSRRTAMMYGISAPANEFVRDQPVMVAVLKSFRYGGARAAGPGKPATGVVPLPPMTKWREPNEGAFVMPVPEGWKMQGGITRLSNTDVRGGIRAWSPDGASMIQFNDVRLDKVLVPGQQPLPSAQLGRGWRMGPHQTGLQMAEFYVQQVWAADLGLTGVEIISRQDRPDLSAEANRVPAQMGLQGYQSLFGEVSFRAMRQGRPVEGRLLGITRMLWSPNPSLMGGQYETEVKGFIGPVGSAPLLARIGGYMEANVEHNYQWILANRQAASRDVQATLNQMRASAAMQQKAFWERMDAADRRREAVNDILGGRTRLRDDQGHEYEARAGSNYYFYDEVAGRTAGRPDDAVVGMDVYPSPVVDLRPLEEIQ